MKILFYMFAFLTALYLTATVATAVNSSIKTITKVKKAEADEIEKLFGTKIRKHLNSTDK